MFTKQVLSFATFFLLIISLVFMACKQEQAAQEKETESAHESVYKMKYPKDKPEAFAEFHNMIRTKPGEDENGYPLNYQFEEFEKAKKRLATLPNRGNQLLNWEERGPGNVGGRTRSIILDERDPTFSTWYLGAVGGGIWKTEDAGITWRNLTEDWPNLGVNTMVQTRDSNIFYAGTGNAFVSRGTNGSGIWKSTDSGETWSVLPSTQNDTFRNVFRLAVNPKDENEILASTLGRRAFGYSSNLSTIMKSTDGGQTWKMVFSSNNGHIQHILYADEFVLYASVNGTGLLRSVDRGENWDLIWSPDDYNFGRIELAAQREIVYMAIDGTNGDNDRIYKSKDFGENFFEVRRQNGNDLGGWLGGQGWFDNTIALNPDDPHLIFAGGQSAIIRMQTNPGTVDTIYPSDFSVVSDGYGVYGTGVGSKGVHVDHHNLILRNNPLTGDLFVLNANDGGIAYSRDGGESFFQTGDSFKQRDGTTYETLKGYITSQFYGVDKMNGADRYVGGTQDNGSWVSEYNPGLDSDWRSAPSGDGFEAAWHYADSNLVLESSQFNNIFRSTDGGVTWSGVNLPPGQGPFITRITNSKLSPDLVFLTSRNGIFRSTDFGLSWKTVQMPMDWEYDRILGPPLEVSLASPRIVWSGRTMNDSSKVCLSIDGGQTFNPVNNYEEVQMGLITGIASHPLDEKIAYVLSSIPDAPKVLVTRDLGQTWEDLSGFNPASGEHETGFPDVATYSLLVMPFDTNKIWAGTEIGIFESLDGGQTWAYANNGFPAAPVWEMKIVNDEIVVATHGRGIWTVSMPELDGYEPTATLALPGLHVNTPFGSDVSGSYELGSPFDSSRLILTDEISGDEIANVAIPGNVDPLEEEFLFDVSSYILGDTLQDVRVQLFAYDDTLTLIEETVVEVFNDYSIALPIYENDFEVNKTDFARRGFVVNESGNNLSTGLNSRHPYTNNSEYRAILRQPILIDHDATVFFDEIVLVEPGESMDPNSPAFYDFVTVEATNNRGATWITLDKYDSGFEDVWQDGYANNMTGDTSLIVTKELDLMAHFNLSDTVFLRFRLDSDPFITGWGWWIDNLNVVSNPSSAPDPGDQDVWSVQVAPNPVVQQANLTVEIPQSQITTIRMYDMNGRLVQHIHEGMLTAGLHSFEVNGGAWEHGIYIIRVDGETLRSPLIRKIIKQ